MTESNADLRYEDLRPGDVIEVKINAPLFPQIHGDWERREVVAVHDGGDACVVRFRDGERVYDVVATEDRGRLMRRVGDANG
ncbi:MAG TPA: hypothetical protein VF032_19560 [Thermoleophilaceae bacterium]